MKRTADLVPPSQLAILKQCRLPRYTLQHGASALLVTSLLLAPSFALARDFPTDATPSDTFAASPQPTESAAALQTNPAFSLTLDSYYPRGLKHARGLKQSSCPDSGASS